jgi:beta-xylosidase
MFKPNEKDAWCSDLGDGTYKNPVLYADYSDPDVIRVNDDFYLISSSFNSSPGIPVLHSKDMVNWSIIGHVFDRLPYDYYNTVRHGEGAWAPAIRYHDGKFWVFFSAPDHGIFMSTAENPAGPWSDLHLVKEVKGWIDTCPFWDEDGQAYLIMAFAHSRCGIKHVLKISRMSPDGRSLLDDPQLVFDGTEHHPTLEGPKLYKREGYYYIFAPAGGVKPGWQTVLRSRDIYGPYEDKIVLHQGNTDVNGPHQGGWVELENGESWFMHFQDRDAYGRIIHLQPVHWEDDWPVMGQRPDNESIGEPVMVWKKPNVGGDHPIAVPAASDDFDAERLGLQWQWEAAWQPHWYSLMENPGHLRLKAVGHPVDSSGTMYSVPQILCQKFPAPVFKATAKISFNPQSDGDRAGLIITGRRYSCLTLSRSSEGITVSHRIGEKTEDGSKRTEREADSRQTTAQTLFLRVEVAEDAVCRFSFSSDNQHFEFIGDSFLADAGVWVGAKIGIFCLHQDNSASEGYADFDWVRVEPGQAS